MTETEKAEVRGWVAAVRNEVYRQMGQFERDKVMVEDARARGAILQQQGQITELGLRVGRLEAGVATLTGEVEEAEARVGELEGKVVSLEARVTLCEGRITRLEAKP